MSDEYAGQLPREAAYGSAQTLVVGIDGSPTSWRAAAYAVGLARRQGRSRLVFVFVAATSGLRAFAPQVIPVALENDAEILDEIGATLHRGLDELGLDWELDSRRGSPFAELKRAAESVRADAVVVGASSRVGHRVAGSLAARLVKSRRWPVIVIP